MVCINKADMKKTGAFQMWIWEEMLKISCLKWWHSWYGTGEEDSAAKDKKKNETDWAHFEAMCRLTDGDGGCCWK